jgi:hypothetical protein
MYYVWQIKLFHCHKKFLKQLKKQIFVQIFNLNTLACRKYMSMITNHSDLILCSICTNKLPCYCKGLDTNPKFGKIARFEYVMYIKKVTLIFYIS